MSNSDQEEKTNYDKAQHLLEKYSGKDAEVIAVKVVAEIEQLKLDLQEEKANASVEVETIHQTLIKLSSEGKIKGKFVVGSDNEYDYYHLEANEETNITLVLIPTTHQYEWKFEEDMQFGAATLPAFDVLYKDLTVIKKTNLLHRLFNAAQADNRNDGAIEKLDELLVINSERQNKALIAEWRETLEYVLADLKDAKSGRSVLVDQLFPYTKNGKTKSYKITKADRTGLVVMIDEELELDRKFHIDSYAYDLIVALMPILLKYKGKSPSTKLAGRGPKPKNVEKPQETLLTTDTSVEGTSPALKQEQAENA
ncbi:MAG: hypothetical protein V4714_10135 [Bacteroidota bacterium]